MTVLSCISNNDEGPGTNHPDHDSFLIYDRFQEESLSRGGLDTYPQFSHPVTGVMPSMQAMIAIIAVNTFSEVCGRPCCVTST